MLRVAHDVLRATGRAASTSIRTRRRVHRLRVLLPRPGHDLSGRATRNVRTNEIRRIVIAQTLLAYLFGAVIIGTVINLVIDLG